MKTKWTILIVAGAILMLLGSQVLAQPWGGGRGRGQWAARGQGLQPRGARVGTGAWCPLGVGPLGINRLFAPRLGLTDDQIQKIRAIVDKAQSEVKASIHEVLTEEQVRQFEQMRERAAQPGAWMRGPGLQNRPNGRGGGRFQQGMGWGDQAGLRGRRFQDQPFGRSRRMGQGQRFQRGAGQPGAVAVPPADANGPGPDSPQFRNRNVPPIEQMFDRADADHDGTLTKEELRAFRESARPGR